MTKIIGEGLNMIRGFDLRKRLMKLNRIFLKESLNESKAHDETDLESFMDKFELRSKDS